MLNQEYMADLLHPLSLSLSAYIFHMKDFRNYQYTLPVVQGLVVDMEVRKTSIKIPSNRYNEVFILSWLYSFRKKDTFPAFFYINLPFFF